MVRAWLFVRTVFFSLTLGFLAVGTGCGRGGVGYPASFDWDDLGHTGDFGDGWTDPDNHDEDDQSPGDEGDATDPDDQGDRDDRGVDEGDTGSDSTDDGEEDTGDTGTHRYVSDNPGWGRNAHGNWTDPGDWGDGNDWDDSGDWGEEGDGSEDGGGDSGGDDAGDGGGDDGEGPVIGEADLVHIEGDRLYALSQVGGLSIISIENPDALVALGRHRAEILPFEMYVEDEHAIVIGDRSRYVLDPFLGTHQWQESSAIQVLDARDPGQIERVAEFELLGEIQDTRRVGDVLYVVTHRDAPCWDCGQETTTTVTAFHIADPAALRMVDQLAFVAADVTFGIGRNVAASAERLYIGGPWYSGTWHDIIHVVDIGAGTGEMELKGTVTPMGEIRNRWQMDEFEGVLRVVSQSDPWSPPVVETFDVASPGEVMPLGMMEMVLPRAEELRSVRFDGFRGYAITFERTDPLFTLDLSDPLVPRQVGELEIPGWVYHMEPRGDRLIGLGYDENHSDGRLNVSVFDVSDFANPTMLSRVAFGGHGDFVENQDRIHKALDVIDDEGLILVPYYGWSPTIDQCGDWGGGIQLIDFDGDHLTVRGVLQTVGRARRGFVDRARLFAVGDSVVQTARFDDRDRPQLQSWLPLATTVRRTAAAGAKIVRLTGDPRVGDWKLDVVHRDHADSPEAKGELDLLNVAGTWVDCREPLAEHLLTDGEHAYILYFDAGGGNMRLLVVDIREPTNLRVVSHRSLPDTPLSQRDGSFPGILARDEYALLHGSALVIANELQYGNPTPEFVIVDVSNPASPRVLPRLRRPRGVRHGGIRRLGDLVVSWYAQAVDAAGDRVAFHLERVNLRDVRNPIVLPPINVPGVPVAYSGSRITTVDFEVTNLNVDWSGCWKRNKAYEHEYDYESGEYRCKLVEHELNTLEVVGQSARRLARRTLHSTRHIMDMVTAQDRLFVLHRGIGGSDAARPRVTPWRDITSTPGAERAVDLGLPETMDRWLARGTGDRLVMGVLGQLFVLDVDDPGANSFEFYNRWLFGASTCRHLEITTGGVFCSLQRLGLRIVPWRGTEGAAGKGFAPPWRMKAP